MPKSCPRNLRKFGTNKALLRGALEQVEDFPSRALPQKTELSFKSAHFSKTKATFTAFFRQVTEYLRRGHCLQSY